MGLTANRGEVFDLSSSTVWVRPRFKVAILVSVVLVPSPERKSLTVAQFDRLCSLWKAMSVMLFQ